MTSRMFFTTLFSAVGAAGIVLFGSDAIEANVKPTISTEAQPLPVVVVPYQLERRQGCEVSRIREFDASRKVLLLNLNSNMTG